MSEMRADIEAVLTGVMDAQRTLADVEGYARQIRDDLGRPTSPLPASALTEDAIVAALKADPAMAGRVMVEVAQVESFGRQKISEALALSLGSGPSVRARALQSLAVALAAASYRG